MLHKDGTETVLYSFTGTGGDGANPYGGLVRDSGGDLYGTTYYGGASGGGTVFEVAANGKETVLYSFSGSPDGQFPDAGLVRDAAGNLYGTTQVGGASDSGTVFKLSKAGKETVLYNFCSEQNCVDGAGPWAGLVRDAAGNLYGTTVGGGDPTCNAPWEGCGVVFMLDKTGKQTVLYSFAGPPDGLSPLAGLIRDEAGNLYGTTIRGGDLKCANDLGCGTVFMLDKTGKETVLHNFCSLHNCTDGASPVAGLVRDAKGSLYGTTAGAIAGGYGYGTVFKLTP
jgi:uncharacterized repeat protein (TIGR03803 family)